MSDSQTLQWQALSRDHHLPPFTDFKALNAKGTRIITRGEGVYLWDSEGHKILDAMAGLWCVNLGYGREELVEAATRQMRELLQEAGAGVSLRPSEYRDGTVGVGGSRTTGNDAVPSIVLAAEQYNMIARNLASGVPVELRVELRTRYDEGDTRTFNVIAEIPGSDPALRDETVLVGAHLDSWHASSGATDNGDGAIAVMEAMAAATIPRGATPAMNRRSCQVKFRPWVESPTPSGLTTRTRPATTASPPRPSARTSSSATSAESSTKSIPTRSTVSWSLNSRSARPTRVSRLPMTTPATVTATKPLGSMTALHASNSSTTLASVKMFS